MKKEALEIIDDVEDGIEEVKVDDSKKKRAVKIMTAILVATLAVSGSVLLFGKYGHGKASTVLAKESVKRATTEYLTSMDSDGQMYKLSKDQINSISNQVSDVVTEDMLNGNSAASKDELARQIESEVARILKEDRSVIAFSDEEKQDMALAVASIVESEIADKTVSDPIRISMTEVSTTNITQLQEQVNKNTQALAELSSKINGNSSYLANLSDKVTTYANNPGGQEGTDSATLLQEINNLKDKISTLQGEYDTLSQDYSNARQTIYSLQVASGAYAEKDDINQVSEAVTNMNESLQLQISTLMNQLAALEATGVGSGDGSANVASNADFQKMKQELETLRNDVQSASDSLSQLMDLPEGGSLAEVLQTYISQIEEKDKSLEEQYSQMRSDIENLQENSEEFSKMYKDYNDLLKEYKQSAKNTLSLAEILSTKGDKKDLDSLRGYAQRLNNQLVEEHEDMMKKLYGGQKPVELETDAKNFAGAVNELKEESDQQMSDICDIYRQIWGLEYQEDASDGNSKQILSDLDEKIQSVNNTLNQLSADYGDGDASAQQNSGQTVTSSSSSLQQAISNVVSAYQTADNAIIDALRQETASRKTADESLQNQITELTNVVTNNFQLTSSDTLAVKKAMGEYIDDTTKHAALKKGSYIFYDGVELGGSGLYYVSADIAENENPEGKVDKTTVSEALDNTHGKIGELIHVLESNEAFAQKYKLK